MNVIVIIVVYMTTCVSMILFNIAYIIHVQRNKTRSASQAMQYEMLLRRTLSDGSERQIRTCQKKWLKQLENAQQLMSFEKGLGNIWETNAKSRPQLLKIIRPVFIHLAEVYSRADNISAAYFAHVVARFDVCTDMEIDYISPFLYAQLKRPSMYCRQNAMEVFESSKSARHMAEAVKLLSEEKLFFHEKRLTDNLVSFQGNHKRLMQLLLASYEELTDGIKKVIIDYLRIKSGDYCEEIHEILMDESADQEVRLAALRYFGKYAYAPAKESLLGFLQQKDEKNWEYTAVAASAMSNYKGKDTESALIAALYHHNWYIRRNAAKALIDLEVPYKNIASIVDGNDRYAREVLIYFWNRRQYVSN